MGPRPGRLLDAVLQQLIRPNVRPRRQTTQHAPRVRASERRPAAEAGPATKGSEPADDAFLQHVELVVVLVVAAGSWAT